MVWPLSGDQEKPTGLFQRLRTHQAVDTDRDHSSAQRFGFLGEGSNRPANASLLLQAGDIETNPGPSCFKCGLTIGTGRPFLSCTSCGVIAHKQQSCSGVSRNLMGQQWTCPQHSYAADQNGAAYDGFLRGLSLANPSQALEPFRASEGDQCDHCGMKLRARATALTCAVPSCNAHCHKKETCSQINRYGNNLEWKCKIHSAPDRNGAERTNDSAACQHASHVTIAGRDVTKLVQTTTVRTEKKTCKLCKRAIASNTTPVECFSCKSSFHKPCLVKS